MTRGSRLSVKGDRADRLIETARAPHDLARQMFAKADGERLLQPMIGG